MNRSDSISGDAHFFRVVFRMLRAIGVALSPMRVNAQHDVAGMGERGFHNRVAKENVGIGADETVVHESLGMKERDENVIICPVGIVTKLQIWIVGPNHVELISAYQNLVV